MKTSYHLASLVCLARRSEILLGHLCSEDMSLNNLVIRLAETFSLHSLHVLTAVDIAAHTKKLMRSCCPYEVPMRARQSKYDAKELYQGRALLIKRYKLS